MTFAEKLREMRDAKGLSEARLAEISGVPFGTIHEYGLGRRKPSLAAAVKLARALGYDCSAFSECEDVANDGNSAAEKQATKNNRARTKKK
jgi:transcriptional regulator with XRE-family HTH domain